MIYKTKVFQKIFKKSNLTDSDLMMACKEMSEGLVDAQLGDSLFKKRIAMSGQGKRGSYRTIVGAVIGKRYFFLYLFAKSDRGNINQRETLALRELAKDFVGFNQEAIDQLIAQGELFKVEGGYYE
jgi:hypothetical protein